MSTGTETSASARWAAKVAKFVEGGMSKKNATSAAASQYPRLRDEYLAEVNEQAQARKRQANATPPAGPATIKWNQVVSGYVERGLPKTESIHKAVLEHPDAHAAMLAEVNQRARERPCR